MKTYEVTYKDADGHFVSRGGNCILRRVKANTLKLAIEKSKKLKPPKLAARMIVKEFDLVSLPLRFNDDDRM